MQIFSPVILYTFSRSLSLSIFGYMWFLLLILLWDESFFSTLQLIFCSIKYSCINKRDVEVMYQNLYKIDETLMTMSLTLALVYSLLPYPSKQTKCTRNFIEMQTNEIVSTEGVLILSHTSSMHHITYCYYYYCCYLYILFVMQSKSIIAVSFKLSWSGFSRFFI